MKDLFQEIVVLLLNPLLLFPMYLKNIFLYFINWENYKFKFLFPFLENEVLDYVNIPYLNEPSTLLSLENNSEPFTAFYFQGSHEK